MIIKHLPWSTEYVFYEILGMVTDYNLKFKTLYISLHNNLTEYILINYVLYYIMLR